MTATDREKALRIVDWLEKEGICIHFDNDAAAAHSKAISTTIYQKPAAVKMILALLREERGRVMLESADRFELDASQMADSVNYRNCVAGMRLAAVNLRAEAKAIRERFAAPSDTVTRGV